MCTNYVVWGLHYLHCRCCSGTSARSPKYSVEETQFLFGLLGPSIVRNQFLRVDAGSLSLIVVVGGA